MNNRTLKQWLQLSTSELDEIYLNAQAGPMPTGDTRGTAIVTGAFLPRLLAHIARSFAWQGKVFDIFADDEKSGILINKITPFSLNFIVAKVYRGNSWLDQKETIVIDYSSTSFFAKRIRDEIRQVEPGLYLGKVWWNKTRILDFALSCPQQMQDHNTESKPDKAQLDRNSDSSTREAASEASHQTSSADEIH